MNDAAKYTLVLLLLVLQFFFWKLDARPLNKIQELRVAETAREMVTNGDWVIPYFNGELRLRKPPLAYWVTATSYTVSGKINEFTARFGSALFASLTVFALFTWLRRRESLAIALTVALCFTSTYLGLRYARNAETDSMLVFFITLSCFQVYQLVFENAGRKQVRLLYLFMGLGFLTKGPAALVIPLGLWLILAIWKKQFRPLRALADPIGIAALLTIAFGWYAFIFFKLPDLAAHWVAEEIDATYITGTHQQPFYFYALHFWKYFFPWALFLIPAAIALYKKHPPAPLPMFAWAWFGLTFIILSLNPSKQTQYALLLSPAVALAIGHYLGAATGGFARFNRGLYALLAIALFIGVSVLLFVWRERFEATAALILILMVALPAGLALLLRIKAVPYVPLLLASAIGAGVMYNQTHLYAADSDRFEVECKKFALAASEYTPLYVYQQSAYGFAPVMSFYAQRVIPVLSSEAQFAALSGSAATPFYVATEKTPEWSENKNVERVLSNGDYSLWLLKP